MIARPSRPALAVTSPVRRLAIAPAPRPHAQLFGGGTLATAVGRVTGRAVQRHRLALIALLATTRRGARGRDQVVTLLWPDADGERGRRLLSDSIYRINRALGVEALATRGDSVELDRNALSSDVAELDRALHERDWQRAIDLYEAPLLDGFYLPNAAEFDQWMEVARARYERAVTTAREALSADGRAAAVAPRLTSGPARGVAVLPFRHIGSAAGAPDFADGLTDDLLAVLGRDATVPLASRLSAFAYREAGFDAPELGRRLEVAWIVDGSVRQSAGALRVAARLTDATTGYQIWSEVFDRASGDVFGTQTELAASIAERVLSVVGTSFDARG